MRRGQAMKETTAAGENGRGLNALAASGAERSRFGVFTGWGCIAAPQGAAISSL
jgi:hypothetical protein